MLKSKEQPLFSVVMPAYNARRFIRMALESVFRQTMQDFEIIVVNDGSTDETQEILESVGNAKLRVITQENGGECVARNRGMREARGKYISFLDSDDVWHENHLEQARNFLEANPDCMWFSSTYTWVSEISEQDIRRPDLSKDSAMMTNWYLEGCRLILPSCVTVRAAIVKDFPHLFQEGYKMFGDNLGWCKLAKKHPMIGIAATSTMLYRFWQGNASTTYNVCRNGVRTEPVKMALGKHAEFYREPDCPEEAKLYYRSFCLGNWWSCITSLLESSEAEDVFRLCGTCLNGADAWGFRLFRRFRNLSLHAMRWGIRRYNLLLLRKMERMSNRTRIRFDSSYSRIE